MTSPNRRPPVVLGFYQTITRTSGEISGGVLVTSHLGRPIEFQCTLPIRTNPTQQILYGSTLLPFIKSELIAEALFDKLQARPDILFVNDPEMIGESVWGEIPLVSFQPLSIPTRICELHQQTLYLPNSQANQYELIESTLLEHIPDTADLQEPLIRVEQALQEAMGQAA